MFEWIFAVLLFVGMGTIISILFFISKQIEAFHSGISHRLREIDGNVIDMRENLKSVAQTLGEINRQLYGMR